jgi:hypothetical protein
MKKEIWRGKPAATSRRTILRQPATFLQVSTKPCSMRAVTRFASAAANSRLAFSDSDRRTVTLLAFP